MDQTADTSMRDPMAAGVEGADQAMRTVAEAGENAAGAMAQGAERMADAGQATAQDAARTAGDAMDAGAARIDDQLRWAAGGSTAAMEGAADYSRAMAQGLQAIAEEWAACARAAAEKTLDRMNMLSQARSPTDLMSAQRDLIWGGFEDVLMAQQRIGKISMSIMADAAQRMTAAPARMAA